MQVNTEKMPKAVKDFIGNAQKTLTTLEGVARRRIEGTYQKVSGSPALKNVERKIAELRQLVGAQLDTNLTPIRDRVQKVSTSWFNKAFSTIGVATKADIKAISGKLERLRGEIRKLLPRRNRADAKSQA